MKSPADKSIAFLFVSHPTKNLAWRWTARLSFLTGATKETLLPIELKDGNQKPIAKGIFEFAGQRLKVEDGRATISYADFIRGKHEVPLWLYRDNILPIPGGLTFG